MEYILCLSLKIFGKFDCSELPLLSKVIGCNSRVLIFLIPLPISDARVDLSELGYQEWMVVVDAGRKDYLECYGVSWNLSIFCWNSIFYPSILLTKYIKLNCFLYYPVWPKYVEFLYLSDRAKWWDKEWEMIFY